MTADPQWFANNVAVAATVMSVLALGVAVISALYARRQASAGEVQARAALTQAEEATRSRKLSESALEAQAQALKSQAAATAQALALAERNAAAAEASADTAARSIAEAKESMHRSLRAYVTIDEILPINNLENAPRDISIIVINTGQTPARRLHVLYRVVLLDGVPQTFAEGDSHYLTWMPTDIGKNQHRTVYGQFLGREELLAKVVDPSFKFIVQGGIRYSDMFSDVEHTTEFCFIWDNRLRGFFPAGPANNII